MTGWRAVLAWTLAAVAGLVLAAGLSTAASTLSRQRIGLSSEPLTAGRALAPHERAPAPTHRPPAPPQTGTPAPTRTTAPTPVATPPPAGGDDGGGDD